MHETLAVQSFSGLAALEQFAEQIDALNLSSARPNPYSSADFLRCFARYNEYALDSDEIRLYTVRDQDRLIGCLPLRRAVDHFGPLRGVRICFLAPFDIDQPGLLCAPEHEERVARAIVWHVRDHEAQFGMLELLGQRPDSVLYQVMHQAANARFRVRDIEVEPFNEIPMVWPDVQSYFRALSSNMRRDAARSARLLFDAGTTELVFAEGAQATSAWFDAYLDLENRSWKQSAAKAIARDARRVEFYRRLVAGHAGFTPSFIGILIDGFLVAGALNGSNAGAPAQARGMWGLEIAYDASYADLNPGQLLLLLGVHATLQRKERFFNLLQNFSYYKRRWKAETIAVKNVQLVRRWSLHNLRGTLGDLVRRLRSSQAPTPAGARGQRDKESADGARRTPVRPDRTQARAMAAQALAYDGPGIQRLSQAQFCELLPFDARQGK